MAEKKVTRRRVIGEVAYRLERVAAMFPRNVQTIAAQGDGRKAARALRELAEVLRDLEDEGPQVAWGTLQGIEDLAVPRVRVTPLCRLRDVGWERPGEGAVRPMRCSVRLARQRGRERRPMSEIAELRDLQREYIKKRNHCYTLIQKQDDDLGNCMPSASLIRACREREDALRAEAAQHQKRINAIQKKLDEAIGVTDD